MKGFRGPWAVILSKACRPRLNWAAGSWLKIDEHLLASVEYLSGFVFPSGGHSLKPLIAA